MKFFAYALLALGASAIRVEQKTTKMSEKDVGDAMNEIGEFIDEHIADHGPIDFDDAVWVCRHIAKEHGVKGCPKAVYHALKGAFEYCDANHDGKVSPAEFKKCYHD